MIAECLGNPTLKALPHSLAKAVSKKAALKSIGQLDRVAAKSDFEQQQDLSHLILFSAVLLYTIEVKIVLLLSCKGRGNLRSYFYINV